MPKYNRNTMEYRLLQDIISKLTVEFKTASCNEVVSFVSSNFNVRRPAGIINDLIDNNLAKVDEDTVYFTNNNKGGEKTTLSKEMEAIVASVSKEGTSRTEVLSSLKEMGFGRTARSLLNQARKEGLIKGTVINKVPTYILVED